MIQNHPWVQTTVPSFGGTREKKFSTTLLANLLKNISATEHIIFLPAYMLTITLIQALSGKNVESSPQKSKLNF